MVSFRNVPTAVEEAGIRSNARGGPVRTVPGMPRHRPLDQLRLRPRDYLAEPHLFGCHPSPAWIRPDGGDEVSLAVAQIQHELAFRMWSSPDSGRARRLTTRFVFSKQTLSLVQHGHTWAAVRVLAGLVWASERPPQGGKRR